MHSQIGGDTLRTIYGNYVSIRAAVPTMTTLERLAYIGKRSQTFMRFNRLALV